jgi:hypothetical protein
VGWGGLAQRDADRDVTLRGMALVSRRRGESAEVPEDGRGQGAHESQAKATGSLLSLITLAKLEVSPLCREGTFLSSSHHRTPICHLRLCWAPPKYQLKATLDTQVGSLLLREA